MEATITRPANIVWQSPDGLRERIDLLWRSHFHYYRVIGQGRLRQNALKATNLLTHQANT
jgi:hypothetical protein